MAVFVGVGVGEEVGVGDLLADNEGVAEAVARGVERIDLVGEVDGVDFEIGALLQSNFLPVLTHRYLTLLTVLVAPALVQVVPATDAAFSGKVADPEIAATVSAITQYFLRIGKS